MPNFIILIGGPGTFKGCDKAHDQSWSNYLVPVQLAAKNNLYNKTAGEQVYWAVYEKPYLNRWADDSDIDAVEKKQDDGYWLHSIRKKAADNVVNSGSANYLQRIRTIASDAGAIYKGISKPEDFF